MTLVQFERCEDGVRVLLHQDARSWVVTVGSEATTFPDERSARQHAGNAVAAHRLPLPTPAKPRRRG